MRKNENYCSNLSVLETAKLQDLENDFIISGIIDKFFIQFILGWKLLKELLQYEGISAAATVSSREIIKQSYRFYSFITEDVWLSMLSDRNNMAHIYDGGAARELADVIITEYIPAFQLMRSELERQYGDLLKTI